MSMQNLIKSMSSLVAKKTIKKEVIKKETNDKINNILNSLLLPRKIETISDIDIIIEKPIGKVKKSNNKLIIKELTEQLSSLNLSKEVTQKYVYKYLVYKDRILSKNKEFNISIINYVNLLHNSLCNYCGDKSNSLDRIDSKIGYTLENCVPCCKLCNTMKWDLSVKDFYLHINKIQKYREN